MSRPDSRRERAARQWALFRFALRDLRGGLRYYWVFIACLVLGVMAVVGVAATARALRLGLAQQGAILLGGDMSFSHAAGAPDARERAFLSTRGKLSEIVTTRAMARRPQADDATMVDVKAVDSAYPLTGRARTEPKPSGGKHFFDFFAKKNGAFGLLADPTLGERLHVKIGDRLMIGGQDFTIAGWLMSEPDSIGGVGFGPRVMMSDAGLAATRLIVPGAVARVSFRLLLPPNSGAGALAVIRRDFQKAFPDAGYEIRTREKPSPRLSRNIERFAQFLTLIGLTSLVCGGVGVGNSIRGLIDRKRKTLAILKALGASGGAAARFVLIQALLVAAASAAFGAALGLTLPFVLDAFLRSSLPFPLNPHIAWSDGLIGLVFGLLTALAFAAAPLDRARSLPATTLLRESAMHDFGPPNWRATAIAGLSTAAFFAFALATGGEKRLTAEFGLAVILCFATLYAAARAIQALARRAPHSRRLALRLAVANLHRPGALTVSFLISLGLGVALLTALVGIERNLRDEIGASLPKNSPNFFFLDIQSAEAGAFRAFLEKQAPEGKVVAAPMLRGRIVKVKGVTADKVKPTDKARWALEGDRGITFATKIPDGSRLVKGHWWPADYSGPPLVSMEQGVARGLGLKIGDSISVNVLGRVVTARVANLRKVDWRSFGINFVLVFSPNAFVGAPFAQVMTLALPHKPGPAREGALISDAARAFPAVTSISMRDALAKIDALLQKLSLAIKSASMLAFVVSALVLAGALAAGQRARLYQAVMLKVLGATRRKLLSALALEFALLGLATAIFGLAAGSAAAFFVATRALDLDFHFFPAEAAAVASGAVVFAICLGLLGTWRALAVKPAPFLREE